MGEDKHFDNPNKEEYNKELVYYCTKCLSLRVIGMEGYECCDECGSTSIEQTTIEEWESLYKAKYGNKYIDNNY